MNRVAYLTSQYPAVSHTFIQREIFALRDLGVHVDTFSIRPPVGNHPLSQTDRAEFAGTFYVLPVRPVGLLRAHLFALATRPWRYIRAAWCAFMTRPGGIRCLVWQLFYLAEAVYLWYEMRRRGIRHVHVHFAMSCASVAMIAHQLGDVSYSMTVHGPTVFYNTDFYCLRQKVRHARLVACISDFCRSQVMAHSRPEDWGKLRVVHCGVELSDYEPRRDLRVDRPGAVQILNVGRLAPVKAHDLLLRAVAELRKRDCDVRCTIVGDGPRRSFLEALTRELGIRDRICFVGAVDQDAIQSYYDEADLFVLPSLAEGVPVVLMEAMAKGLPVVTSRVMGIPELVEDGVHGRLVSPGRVEPLVVAIAELVSDPQVRHRMGSNGREKVRSEFDVRVAAEQLSSAFAEVLRESATPQPSMPAIPSMGETGA